MHTTLFIIIVILILAGLFRGQSFADGSCLTINNGGITTQEFCPTPTPTPQVASQSQDANQQTNNDAKVYPSSNATSTPNTGPDTWSLAGLFVLGGMGFFLRNKAKT